MATSVLRKAPSKLLKNSKILLRLIGIKNFRSSMGKAGCSKMPVQSCPKASRRKDRSRLDGQEGTEKYVSTAKGGPACAKSLRRGRERRWRTFSTPCQHSKHTFLPPVKKTLPEFGATMDLKTRATKMPVKCYDNPSVLLDLSQGEHFSHPHGPEEFLNRQSSDQPEPAPRPF